MPDKLSIEQRHGNFCANREQKNIDSYAEVQPKVTTARSRNMAAIRAKDTKPEIIVRKFLWARGFRYRLNHPRLPGKPDVVLRKYRTCIFVNGCFWHGHEVDCDEENRTEGDVRSSECCKIPNTNREFWVRKITRNKRRDVEVQRKLAAMGWHSVTVWECELKPARRERTLESLAFTLNHIFLEDHRVRRYVIPEDDSIAMAAEELIESTTKNV